MRVQKDKQPKAVTLSVSPMILQTKIKKEEISYIMERYFNPLLVYSLNISQMPCLVWIEVWCVFIKTISGKSSLYDSSQFPKKRIRLHRESISVLNSNVW